MVSTLTALLAALLVAGALPIASAHDTFTAVRASAPRLIDQRRVEIPDGQPVALSPDGRWLAVHRRAEAGFEFCAYDAASLTEHACARIATSSLARDAAVWSPDGTRLAFTEDWVEESDLWVFEAERGIATNLTDDGIAGDFFNLTGPAKSIDFAPAWAPDGQELAFARVQAVEEAATTAIYRMPAAGGDPTLVLHVADQPWAIVDRLRWSPAGDLIIYTAALPLADEPILGVYGVAPGGGEPRQIGDDLALSLNLPLVVDVSARGTALIFFGRSFDHPVDIPAFGLLDLESGALETLAPTRAGSPESLLGAAGFSPDGSRLLLAYSDASLVVRDLDSGQDSLLAKLTAPIEAEITWAANGLVFGRGRENTGLLLQLTEG